MRKVLIVAHGGRPDVVIALREAVRDLVRAGFEVIMHDDDLDEPAGTTPQAQRIRENVTDCEVVLVLGGDGTILRAAELTHGTLVPLLGVNLGHVGFLAESERHDLQHAVDRIVNGDFVVEERSLVDVTVYRPGASEPIKGWALNEATVDKARRERMMEVAVGIDGRPVSSFGCDGVILATPTGSTAHAFSAGGPVVWPDVAAVLLVPLAAHALFSRPLVVGPKSVITVDILGRSPTEGIVACDGRRRIDLPTGSRVEVRHSNTSLLLARLGTSPFADRLVSKFSLPVSGWRERGPQLGRRAAGSGDQAGPGDEPPAGDPGQLRPTDAAPAGWEGAESLVTLASPTNAPTHAPAMGAGKEV